MGFVSINVLRFLNHGGLGYSHTVNPVAIFPLSFSLFLNFLYLIKANCSSTMSFSNSEVQYKTSKRGMQEKYYFIDVCKPVFSTFIAYKDIFFLTE